MITPEEHKAVLVSNALHREEEIYGYQLNIDNFQAAINLLPDEPLPESLAKFAGCDPNSIPASLTDEEHDQVVRFNYRAGLVQRIRAERAQLLNATTMRDVLKAQIGKGYDTLVKAEKSKAE